MANQILTTHVGSLPRPAKFIEVSQKRTLGEKFDEAAYEAELKNAVIDVVRKQKDAGVDLINDGELAHTMGWAYDFERRPLTRRSAKPWPTESASERSRR